MTTTKRGRGRPRLHKDTELVTFRCSAKLARAIRAAIASVKLLTQQAHAPVGPIIAEVLQRRLRQLTNVNPVEVERQCASLDRGLEDYAHLEEIGKQARERARALGCNREQHPKMTASAQILPWRPATKSARYRNDAESGRTGRDTDHDHSRTRRCTTGTARSDSGADRPDHRHGSAAEGTAASSPLSFVKAMNALSSVLLQFP